MRCTRIYYPHSLNQDQIVTLTDQAANHLRNVLRAALNEECVLFNGDGNEYLAQIKTLTKKEVCVKIISVTAGSQPSPLAIHLGQGISRGEKMDWVIQKCTELGVRDITPLITERCNVRLEATRWEKKRAHWQAIANSACEQSGRADVVTIFAPELLTTWLSTSFSGTRIMLDPCANRKISQILPCTSIQLLIGSEGGFSEDEIAKAQHADFIGISLGSRILRSETAPITAVSILQNMFGDL